MAIGINPFVAKFTTKSIVDFYFRATKKVTKFSMIVDEVEQHFP